MQQRAAGVHHVRDVAFALGFVWGQQRFPQAPDYARGVFQVEQERAEAILAHGAHAVTQHQPARLRLDGRAAVADLDEFPRLRGRQQQLGCLPEMDVVREHQEDVLIVLAREHGVLPVDFAREQRHALVLHGGAVERVEFEMDKVRRLQQLRQGDLAVVRGVGRVVGEAAVVVLEADEARVLDAVALAGRGRKEDALRNAAAGSKVDFVV